MLVAIAPCSALACFGAVLDFAAARACEKPLLRRLRNAASTPLADWCHVDDVRRSVHANSDRSICIELQEGLLDPDLHTCRNISTRTA